MQADQTKPETIDAYIAGCAPEVQPVLQSIRETVRRVAPQAQECISYRMPAFRLNGPLVYFAAFKQHVGFYPPVRDVRLQSALAPYAGEKGNLRFALDRPMPLALIARIVKARVRENAQIAAARRKR